MLSERAKILVVSIKTLYLSVYDLKSEKTAVNLWISKPAEQVRASSPVCKRRDA
jgi:hypothetical protein